MDDRSEIAKKSMAFSKMGKIYGLVRLKPKPIHFKSILLPTLTYACKRRYGHPKDQMAIAARKFKINSKNNLFES